MQKPCFGGSRVYIWSVVCLHAKALLWWVSSLYLKCCLFTCKRKRCKWGLLLNQTLFLVALDASSLLWWVSSLIRSNRKQLDGSCLRLGYNNTSSVTTLSRYSPMSLQSRIFLCENGHEVIFSTSWRKKSCKSTEFGVALFCLQDIKIKPSPKNTRANYYLFRFFFLGCVATDICCTTRVVI